MRITGLLFLVGFFVSCSGAKTYIDNENSTWETNPSPSESELVYKMFLIGDVGAPSLDVQEPTLKLFENFTSKASDRSAAVFLGDNIYTHGLPDSTSPDRAIAEARINQQLNALTNFKGRIVFVPGNHDWDDGGRDGLKALQRQEKYIEDYLDRGNTFLPDNGFPGPVDLKLLDKDDDPRLRNDIRLIVLDTQWWLHKHEKSYGETGDYELSDGGDFLIELENLLKKREKDFLVFAAHHPLITLGPHGGYSKPSTHLNPPIIGSLYAFYRKAFGYEQDTPHFKYKELSRTLRKMFSLTDHLIYASGHSHSLQYLPQKGKRETQHYIVSGAGSKENYVSKGRGSEFTHQGKGFITLNYYGNGSVWMEAWAPVGDGSEGKLLFRTELKPPYSDPLLGEDESELIDIDYTDSTVVVAPNEMYDEKGSIFRAIAGNHNRNLWSIKSEYPVFDVTEMKEGLELVRTGGKGQSTTLHLEDKNGREYVLRSVDKQAGKIWDENLKKTVALDLVQDQYSYLNPFAALLVPPLASAVGIYHTNPKIYFVPNDPQLGDFGKKIGGQLALFEEKPDGDMRDVESVGNSKKIVAYRDMIREVDNDIDHRVDQELFARSRLFDMLIGDWDRHSDQWRWATFEPEDKQGKIYRPIPRDRDVSFMKMDGIGPTIAKLGPFFQYQNFGADFGNLKGLNFNGLPLTRRFTNQLTKKDWIAIAIDMQSKLTNEVIESAIRKYPKEVFEIKGAETIHDLKVRRDNLVRLTEIHYEMISSVVSIPGSNKRERFVIEVLDEKQTRIQIYKLSGKEKLREKYFDRIFISDEHQELRLYGMGGNDEFIFLGPHYSGIKLLVSGGPGEDIYKDESPNKAITKRLIGIFETKSGNQYDVSGKAHLHLAKNPIDNYYDYEEDFEWNRYYPGYFFNYNSDEGLFIGGGPKILRNGFRKFPAVTHYLRFNYAPSSGAANLLYSGVWYDRVGNFDFGLESAFLFPKSFRNFFGLGNETTIEDRNSKFYRAKLTRYSIEPHLITTVNDALTISFGNRVSLTQIDDNRDENNVVSLPQLGFSNNTFKTQWFNTTFFKVRMRDIDTPLNPSQGYNLMFTSDLNVGLYNTTQTFSRISSELSMYFPINFSPQITFANRTGGAHNIGTFPFYESNSIGGTTNLRGYRGNRFSGRSTFYNNTELRLELFDFYRYLLGGKVGISAFYDTGRVWSDGDDSNFWHKGYGGGIWFNILDSFVISSTLGHSVEGNLFEIKAGFFF